MGVLSHLKLTQFPDKINSFVFVRLNVVYMFVPM